MSAGPTERPSTIRLTSEIVAAYMSKNSVEREHLVRVIASVYEALVQLQSPGALNKRSQTPAVDPKQSVSTEFLISLEDGKHYKTLTRHLKRRGLTPDEYRAKWGLAGNYPMVAPAYAKARSDLAKRIGLGRARKKPSNVVKMTSIKLPRYRYVVASG